MKRKLYFTIALRIILLMTFGFLFTFVTPHLREFLGDKPCGDCNGIDAAYSWGIRHYWYAWTIFLLFMLSLVDCIMTIVTEVKRHYPNI